MHGALLIGAFFLVKMLSKLLGIWPVASRFSFPQRERAYTTLLMATGLTFGSIAALYGLTNQLIDQSQYSQLVTVVILSALVPTLIAQQFFQPTLEAHEDVDDQAAAEDLATTHHAYPALDPADTQPAPTAAGTRLPLNTVTRKGQLPANRPGEFRS